MENKNMKKINKKGAGVIGGLMIAVITFGILFGGLVYVYSEYQQEYNFTTDSELNGTMQQINQTSELTQQMTGRLQNESSGSFDNVVSAGFNSLRMSFGLIGILESMISSLSTIFGIPPWIVTAFMILVSIIILSAIISFIRGVTL